MLESTTDGPKYQQVATQTFSELTEIDTVSTAAYTTGDSVGSTPFQWATGWIAGKGILLTNAQLICDVNSSADFSLHLYNALPSTQTDNSQISLTGNEFSTCMGIIQFSSVNSYDMFTSRIFDVSLNKLIHPSDTNIYGILRADSGFTLSGIPSTGLRIRLHGYHEG